MRQRRLHKLLIVREEEDSCDRETSTKKKPPKKIIDGNKLLTLLHLKLVKYFALYFSKYSN